MPDIVDRQTRSRMMSGIRGKNTKPELLIRKALHAAGYRYRLHPRDVAGRPDLVLPKYRTVVFVHGCFWHGHACKLFKWPGTRRKFWTAKIRRNRARDADVAASLAKAGWRRLTIWECAIRGRHRLGLEDTVSRVIRWLRSGRRSGEIRGLG